MKGGTTLQSYVIVARLHAAAQLLITFAGQEELRCILPPVNHGLTRQTFPRITWLPRSNCWTNHLLIKWISVCRITQWRPSLHSTWYTIKVDYIQAVTWYECELRQAEQEVAAAEEIKDSSVLCSAAGGGGGGGGGGGTRYGRQHRCEVTSLYQRTRQQTRTRPSECGNQQRNITMRSYMMRPSWKYIILFLSPFQIQHSNLQTVSARLFLQFQGLFSFVVSWRKGWRIKSQIWGKYFKKFSNKIISFSTLFLGNLCMSGTLRSPYRLLHTLLDIGEIRTELRIPDIPRTHPDTFGTPSQACTSDTWPAPTGCSWSRCRWRPSALKSSCLQLPWYLCWSAWTLFFLQVPSRRYLLSPSRIWPANTREADKMKFTVMLSWPRNAIFWCLTRPVLPPSCWFGGRSTAPAWRRSDGQQPSPPCHWLGWNWGPTREI